LLRCLRFDVQLAIVGLCQTLVNDMLSVFGGKSNRCPLVCLTACDAQQTPDRYFCHRQHG
jgi:hypothetical protein